ncbi:MAG: peptidylprolyl isomerase [Clostridia bacterium]|nr:peptidylprolyl isomerase [Clostridia bacterium]
MSKKIGIICVIAVILAAVFCLYQFTDVFGAKQSKPAAVEAQAPAATVEPVTTTEAPAAEPTAAPTEEPAAEPTEAPAEEPAAEPTEAPAAEAKDENPVLATVDGTEIKLAEVRNMLNTLVSGGYITDATDYKTALDYLIQTRLLSDKVKELGFDQFTAKENAAFAESAKAEWDSAIQQYVSYFGGGEGDDAEKVRQEAIAYYEAYGITEETIVKQLQAQASQEKLEAYLLEGKDLAVTEEEIRAIFEEAAQQDMASFDGNIGTYELYQTLYGQQFFFVPEGYRGIIHILLNVDEALMDTYTKAQSAYEESVTEEKPEGDDALKAAVDEAREAILASQKEAIDDIYARLEKGEEFTALIEAYNQDPGMKKEGNLTDGYHVHKDSLIYDPMFTAAAFSDKMVKPGDVSDPVVSKSGIHILYYLRDVPSGMIEMTDDIRAEIEAYLDTSKKNKVFVDAMSEWQTQHEIVYNQEAIYSLTAETPAE